MRAHRILPFACLAPLAAAAPFQEPAGPPAAPPPEAEAAVVEAEEEEIPRPGGAPAELLHCLPGDAVWVVSAHDLDGVRAAAEGNAWFRFLRDEQVRPLVDALWDELESGTGSGEGEEGVHDVDPYEVLESIHGSVLAFLVPVGEGLEPGFGLVVDPGEDSAAFASLHARLMEQVGRDAGVSTDSYEEVELVVFESRGADSDVIDTLTSFEVDGLYGLVGSRGVQNTLDLAQGVVDRRRGTGDSEGMDTNPWFAGARGAAGTTEAFEMFLDLGRVLDMTVELEEMAEEERDTLDLLGLFDTRWVYASAGVGAGEDLDLGLHVHMPRTGALHAMLDLFGPLPLGMGRLMPRDSSSVGLFSFDVWGLYRGVMDLMEDHYPDEYPQMREQIDGMAQMTGLDFENDLLAQLTGEFGSFSMEVPEEESLMGVGGALLMGAGALDTSMGGATIVGLKDSGLVAEFLDRALAMAGVDPLLQTEEFEGARIHHLAAPEGGLGVWWAFLDDSLVFSFYPTAVRSALGNANSPDAPSALDNERFSAALQPLTRQPVVSLTDTRTYLRTMLGFGDMLGQAAGAGSPLGGFDAPEASLVDEYFSGTMLFAVQRGPESFGLRFSTF